MLPNVEALDMVPSRSSHPHGPPSLGRVRTPSRSPTSPLVCSPPTPSSPSVAAPVPLADNLPRCECCRGRTRASQVPGPSSFVRAVVRDPAGCDPSSPVLHGAAAVAFRQFNALGTPVWHSFRGYQPTAHRLACLRIAGPVAGAVARLATGPGGLTPGRAGFAPAGHLTKFHGGIATSYPLRPALPGRTEFPMRPRSER